MKTWQRETVVNGTAIIGSNAETLQSPIPVALAPLSQVQPLVQPESGLTLEQRISGLENKAHYDGQQIAQLKANLEVCGQAIDLLSTRITRQAEMLLKQFPQKDVDCQSPAPTT